MVVFRKSKTSSSSRTQHSGNERKRRYASKAVKIAIAGNGCKDFANIRRDKKYDTSS